MNLATLSFDKRVRNILLKHEVLDEESVDRGMAAAQEAGRSLTSTLVQMGVLTERELIGVVAREMRIPPIDLDKVEPDSAALEALPQQTALDYGVLPVSKIGNTLTIAVSNPFDIVKLDDLRILTRCDLRPVISSVDTIRRLIDERYNADQKEMNDLFEGVIDQPELEFADDDLDDEIDLSDLSDLSGEGSPVVKLVNLIIYKAVKERSSDIHIEPFEGRVRVRFRQDGRLHEVFNLPRKIHNAITSRIKILSNLDIAEKRKSQDGKFQIRIESRQVDFRVSVLPVVHGEKIVLRILDAKNITLSLDTLGFEPHALEGFRRAVTSPYGMILVTGPTGSGKSTTLYSAIKEILNPESNFVTVEDPVEYQLDGVCQVHVNPKRGVTFATALRSILRQDPDVILVGEIRDTETVEVAVKAALTGHLVLSTLHTNDAPSTVTRMIDMGVDPFMVASSVLMVAAQRLCRKLCDACKEPFSTTRDSVLRLGLFDEDVTGDVTIYKAKGCTKCVEGYRGRFALLEAMTLEEDLKRLILDGRSALEIKKVAIERGMISLRRCGLLNVLRGRTSVEEVLRVTLAD
jgi:type IV pilus assembly protein PilB